MTTNLRRFRVRKGESVKEMASKLHVSESTIYKIETSTRSPTFKLINRFKKVYEVDVEEIFFDNHGTD